MKKLHGLFMAICLAVIPALQSCDDVEGYSLGDMTPPLWATVRVTGSAFYLDCDVWGTLWPVNTNMGWYNPADGQRVITTFNPLWDNYEGFDHAVKILTLEQVLTKEVETLTPENDGDFGNDPVYGASMGISGGYMNLYFTQNLPAKTRHRISLVRPADDKELYGEDGYIHLELRYNTYDDVTGIPQPAVVSYNLNSLDITSETKGIKLKLNSGEDGETEVVFERESPDDNTEKMRNLDLSKVQLK